GRSSRSKSGCSTTSSSPATRSCLSPSKAWSSTAALGSSCPGLSACLDDRHRVIIAGFAALGARPLLQPAFGPGFAGAPSRPGQGVRDVTRLPDYRQGPDGREQCFAREQQDQAPLPAEPALSSLLARERAPLGAPAGLERSAAPDRQE